MLGRDLVVVGASLGGVECISELLSQLPKDLPAAVLIVQHTTPDRDSKLADVWGRSSALPVSWARDEETPVPGRVYVARPGHHLVLTGTPLERWGENKVVLRVGRGPRENGARPAIDPLFRSAAVYGRGRTIGVILIGLLDDGARGPAAVKRCGGTAVVLEPDDAPHSEMPRNALLAGPVDHVVKIESLGQLVASLVRQPAPPSPDVNPELLAEVKLTEKATTVVGHYDDLGENSKIGELALYTCPECGGSALGPEVR